MADCAYAAVGQPEPSTFTDPKNALATRKRWLFWTSIACSATSPEQDEDNLLICLFCCAIDLKLIELTRHEKKNTDKHTIYNLLRKVG